MKTSSFAFALISAASTASALDWTYDHSWSGTADANGASGDIEIIFEGRATDSVDSRTLTTILNSTVNLDAFFASGDLLEMYACFSGDDGC